MCMQGYKCIRFTQDAIHLIKQRDKSVLLNSIMEKGVLNGMFVFYQFLFINRHTSTDFEDIFTDHFNWCILSDLEFIALSWNEGGERRLRFKAASWKKGYSRNISCFTNFAVIYWTCLVRFGGKFHFRSCNLAHTVRDFD